MSKPTGSSGEKNLVGDGVRQSKEGRHMPGVKKLFQESENSSKPEYIHGHISAALEFWPEIRETGPVFP